jgi:hypothetical protein
MQRRTAGTVVRFDFGEVTCSPTLRGAALRLARGTRSLRGPEKYRLLDLKRRRAQIHARRVLGLI